MGYHSFHQIVLQLEAKTYSGLQFEVVPSSIFSPSLCGKHLSSVRERRVRTHPRHNSLSLRVDSVVNRFVWEILANLGTLSYRGRFWGERQAQAITRPRESDVLEGLIAAMTAN